MGKSLVQLGIEPMTLPSLLADIQLLWLPISPPDAPLQHIMYSGLHESEPVLNVSSERGFGGTSLPIKRPTEVYSSELFQPFFSAENRPQINPVLQRGPKSNLHLDSRICSLVRWSSLIGIRLLRRHSAAGPPPKKRNSFLVRASRTPRLSKHAALHWWRDNRFQMSTFRAKCH